MTGCQTISVLLKQELVTLNRAFGMLRRRNLPIKSIAVGPSASPGLARLTIMMQTDQATADRTAKQLDKVVGVREVAAFPAREAVARELALVKVRPGGGNAEQSGNGCQKEQKPARARIHVGGLRFPGRFHLGAHHQSELRLHLLLGL